MKVYCLVDNNAINGFKKEWGLSLLVDTTQGQCLIDTGKSSRFASNAKRMGLDLSDVKKLYLSHAHYDHCNGVGTFLKKNREAPIVVAEGAAQNCYSRHRFTRAYIGIRRGLLDRCGERLVRTASECSAVSGTYGVGSAASEESVRSIPHFLEPKGGTGSMFLKTKEGFVPDTFRHEQTVVISDDDGRLVVFSPCSHLGFEAIIDEVRSLYPGREIKAYFGGLHVFRKSDEAVRELAHVIGKSGVGRIFTGHCTGDRAVGILQQELGDMVSGLAAGAVYEI